MTKTFLALFTFIILAFGTIAQAQDLSLPHAGNAYSASLDESAQLANKALPLIAAITGVNNQAAKLGKTPKTYLSAKDFKIYRDKQVELNQLFAMQKTENALTKDILTLDKLYQAVMFYHNARSKYVQNRGTEKGFEKWFKAQKMNQEMKNTMELLSKIRLQIQRTPIQ